MGATIVAFLKAFPALVNVITELRDEFKDFKDRRDDAILEEYKRKTSIHIERLKHAKSKAETASIIAELNSL